MITKIYRVTDLGPGDGGKGGVVQALCRKTKASLVIKEGGAQGSHGVAGNYGNFCFSQWGCGSLDYIPTYISPNFVMAPLGLLNEARSLAMFEPSVKPWNMISAAPSCICATPYHQAWSKIYELLLKDKPHGTVGTGVGKAYADFLNHPQLAIRARDLADEATLRRKLLLLRERVNKMYEDYSSEDVLPEDVGFFRQAKSILASNDVLEDIVDKCRDVGNLLRIDEYEHVLSRFNGVAIIERSHGVLTDREAGFKPHVSNLRTLPSISDVGLVRAKWHGEIVELGVHRAYEIRHGAGPIPTANAEMLDSLLPGSHKLTNRWQGEVRVGALDLRLLHYAIRACGEPTQFDGLCMTWFDQIIENGEWQICTDYRLNGHIIPRSRPLDLELLNQVEPVITSLPVPQLDKEALAKWCAEVMSQYLDLPVRLVSFGPKPGHKIFI